MIGVRHPIPGQQNQTTAPHVKSVLDRSLCSMPAMSVKADEDAARFTAVDPKRLQ